MLPDFTSSLSIQKYRLHNSQGTEVEILNLGAILHSWKVRTFEGIHQDLIVGPKQLDDYLKTYESRPYYFGATVGRYAGRIRQGFHLNGQWYPLDADEHGVHLHGGPLGIDRKIWELDEENSHLPGSLVLYCESGEGEGGYPGKLQIEARYTLHDDDSLELEYRAISDADTFLNLTNHVYFNLDGESITEQSLQLAASKSLETNTHLLPTGRFLPVQNTELDFRTQRKMDCLKEQAGLDHCFLLDSQQENTQVLAYHSKKTKLALEAWTNQPALVVFAPEQLSVEFALKEEQPPFPSICFEFQNVPDAPNFPQFPSALLKKGEVYRHWSRFGLRHL